MFRRIILSAVAIVALATPFLFLPAQAQAVPDRQDRWEHRDRRDRHARPELRRVVWQYPGGFFKDEGPAGWVESNASGTYHFREMSRNPQFVDLFDASRGFTVRLYNNAMYLQGGSGYPTFTKFYDGSWTE